MITLTKEWLLKTIAELEEERDATQGAVNEDAALALAAMKRALASLMTEPDYYVVVTSVGVWQSFCKTKAEAEFIVSKPFNPGYSILEIYTAPPAPEFYKIGDATMRHIFTPTGITDVSDMQAVFDQIETVLTGMWQPAPVSVPDALPENDDEEGNDIDYMEPSEVYIFGRTAGWNACRAAMLQGAEPVTTAYKLPFDRWLLQQTGTIDVECGCVMTEVFFHWLRVAYEAGNSPVIPYGWVACSERMPEQFVEVLVCTEDGSRYVAALNQSMNWDDGDFFDDIQYVTHWMPLPAAPQQEV